MGSEKLSVSVSSTTRRVIAVAIAAALLAALAIAARPTPADAETVETDVSVVCESVIGPQGGPSVAIPVTAVNSDEQIEPGDQTSITLSGAFPSIVDITTYWVNWSEGTWPIPPQVDTIDAVSFGTSEGWTPPEDWAAEDPLPVGLEVVDNVDGEGGYVRVRFEGGEGTSTNPSQTGNIRPTPSITITVTVNEEDTDYYLEWKTFNLQQSNAWTILSTNEGDCLPCFTPDDYMTWTEADREAYVEANCPGEGVDQVVNSVTQVGSPDPTTTTTSSTTSTTSSTTTSTTTSTTSTTLRPSSGTTTRPSYTG